MYLVVSNTSLPAMQKKIKALPSDDRPIYILLYVPLRGQISQNGFEMLPRLIKYIIRYSATNIL